MSVQLCFCSRGSQSDGELDRKYQISLRYIYDSHFSVLLTSACFQGPLPALESKQSNKYCVKFKKKNIEWMINSSDVSSISAIGYHFKILWGVILKPNLLELFFIYCLSSFHQQRLFWINSLIMIFCLFVFLAAGLLSPYLSDFSSLVRRRCYTRISHFSLFITSVFAGCLNPLVHWTDVALHFCVWWTSWLMNFSFLSWPVSFMLSFFLVPASDTA